MCVCVCTRKVCAEWILARQAAQPTKSGLSVLPPTRTTDASTALCAGMLTERCIPSAKFIQVADGDDERVGRVTLPLTGSATGQVR